MMTVGLDPSRIKNTGPHRSDNAARVWWGAVFGPASKGRWPIIGHAPGGCGIVLSLRVLSLLFDLCTQFDPLIVLYNIVIVEIATNSATNVEISIMWCVDWKWMMEIRVV